MTTWTEPEKRITPTRKQRVEIFMRTQGKCYKCDQRLLGDWEAEHPQALTLMGTADIDALMPICKPCHKVKTASDKQADAKAKRVRDKHIGAMKSKNPIPGSRGTKYRKRMDGTVEIRK